MRFIFLLHLYNYTHKSVFLCRISDYEQTALEKGICF